MRFLIGLVGAILLFDAANADGGGLIYQFPEDGTWERFTIEESSEGQGSTLVLASVGRENVQGEPCRWIELRSEVRIPGDEKVSKRVVKALVSEKRVLKESGKSWLRGWMKLEGRQPVELTPRFGLGNPGNIDLW
jgi:hypothetical protein